MVLCEVCPGVKARRLAVLDLELFAALIAGETTNNSQQQPTTDEPAG